MWNNHLQTVKFEVLYQYAIYRVRLKNTYGINHNSTQRDMKDNIFKV